MHLQTYGGHFTSSSIALVAFRIVEFNKNKELFIKYKFQADEVNKSKDSKYNMIIGSDILHDLQIDLLYSKEKIRWGSPNNPFKYNSIPMKELGSISDEELCAILYDLQTTTPMLQTEEERLGKILDVDYSKVDINDMVDGLDVTRATKQKLK